MLKVTLSKSMIGAVPKNRKTVNALGLRKIGQSNTFEDTASIRGMIHQVKHLLTVEEVEDQPIVRRRRGNGAQAAAKPAAKKAPAKAEAKAEEKPKAAAKKAPAKKATEAKSTTAKKATTTKKTTKKDKE